MRSWMRQPVRIMTLLLSVGLVLAGCSGWTSFGAGRQVPAGPLAPIVPAVGGGPPIECRGVPIQRCQESWGGGGDPDIVRVIITCTKVCTPSEGEYDIHALRPNGSVEAMGGGGYAGAIEQ